MLSRRTHSRLWTPRGVKAANERILSAVVNGTPLVLGGKKLICTQCHFGPGYWPKRFGVTWDSHEDLQVEIPLTGRFDFEIEGRHVALTPGTALTIAARKVHIWNTPSGGFMLGLFVRALSSNEEHQTLVLQKSANHRLTKAAVISQPLKSVLGLVAKSDFSAFDANRLQLWLSILITDILESALDSGVLDLEVDAEGKNLRYALVIRNVVERIESRLDKPLLADDLAREAGVSVRHLNRLFAQFKGETLHRYIVHQRVQKARSLFENDPSLPIKYVAAECGFADASHLGNAFKKNFQISPGRFTENLRR